MTTRIIKVAALLMMMGPMFAGATPVFSGSIAGDGEWGIIQFYHSGGTLAIDIWGNGYNEGINDGLDDPYITLMHDNGSPLTAVTGAYMGANDDSHFEGFHDGSTSALDSYMSVNIAANSYLLAISHCCQGFNNSRDISDLTSGVRGTSLDYQVTFTSINDIRITAVDGRPYSAVPEPGSLALLGLGLAGLGFNRRTKKV